MDDVIRDHVPAIYLDIDGVVTTEPYQAVAGRYALDPSRVAMVAALARDAGARVVVSSTWRVEDCRPALVGAGLPEGCFHPDWRTAIPASSRDPATGAMLPAEMAGRGAEIAEHAARNGLDRFVVLDDVDVGAALAPRHVRPDPERGLVPSDMARARSILAAGSPVRRDRAA